MHDDESDIIWCSTGEIKQKVKNKWDSLPIFRDSMHKVPTIHLPHKKTLIKKALQDSDFMVSTKCDPGIYFYPC